MNRFVQYSITLIILLVVYFPLYVSQQNSHEITLADFLRWKIEKKRHATPSYGNPDKAMQWFYEQRAYPLGYIPEHWREEALSHIKQHNLNQREEKSAAALNWTPLGPGNIGGRIRSIIVHPSNSNIIYLGSVSGGVWKTTNGGTNWFPLKDNMENLAVCSMVMDPANSNVIYAGTGEGYFNLDAVRGAGIFKTTDGGTTWTQLSSTANQNFYYVNKLVFDNTTNILWAATRKGLYKSTNGGGTFTGVLTNSSGYDVHCTDVEIAGTNPTTILAAFGLFGNGEVYRSSDAGNTWASVLGNTNYGRIEIAMSSSNPMIGYVSIMDPSTNGTGLFGYTTDGGINWTTTTVPGPSYSGATTYTGTQAWYDNILFVDPSNASIVYAGGIDFWKSTNGGSSWTQKTNWYPVSGYEFVHADHHAIAFDPSNSNVMYLGTDGGIFKSTNKGESWTALNNNLFITQFYYGAVAPTGTTYYGGTQDNGTLKSTGSTLWSQILGGDGGATEVDFSTPTTMYMEYVNLAFYKSTNGGSSYVKSMNGIPAGPGQLDGTTDRVQFIAPFSMDPNNSNTLVAGTYRVFRTTNGASNWSAISGDLTGDGTGQNGATISTVIIAMGNSNVIYAGCSNGRVQVTTDGGTTWNLRNSGLPTATCTRIATDPGNPAIAYATFSGYLSGSKVYKTTNYGVSWTNISSNLPNIPANCIVVNPLNSSTLYVGTDLGVFTSTNGGGSWTQDNSGLPNVVVSDLDYRSSDSTLFAATHGRGMYTASLGSGGGGQTIVELAYDDGIPFGGYIWNSNGQASANRMTPTITGAKLIEMSIYITGVDAGMATYTPILLNNNSGQPGSAMATLSPKTATSYPGWDATDLSSLNLTINGDFFIGLMYDGTNKPGFGYDQADNGRAWDNDGMGWTAWNETYFMRAKLQTLTSVVEIDSRIPKEFLLYQNYPNPFNPTTTIRYALPEGRDVHIVIYDVAGRKITDLVNNYQTAGSYEVTWNGKDDAGNSVASGVYFTTIKAGNVVQTRRMMLLK
jgi:photosystem II stability/assembly factor-like uncharacterized protein